MIKRLRMLATSLAMLATVAGLPVSLSVAEQEEKPKGGQPAASEPERRPEPDRDKPAPTFKPSERIRADSTVAFPVDI